MSIVFNTKTYANDVSRSPDIMRYLGPGHTLSKNDYVDLARTAAKPTATYAGKGRTRFKLTRGATDGVTTASLGDIIVDLAISIPIGTAEAEMDAVAADLASIGAAAWFELFSQDQKIVQ